MLQEHTSSAHSATLAQRSAAMFDSMAALTSALMQSTRGEQLLSPKSKQRPSVVVVVKFTLVLNSLHERLDRSDVSSRRYARLLVLCHATSSGLVANLADQLLVNRKKTTTFGDDNDNDELGRSAIRLVSLASYHLVRLGTCWATAFPLTTKQIIN